MRYMRRSDQSRQFSDQTQAGASNAVLSSILDSRVSQMRAITLPCDSNRVDVLEAIDNIASFDRKLMCFLDYMIDYSANLNMSLGDAQSQLDEVSDVLGSLNRQSELRDYNNCLKELSAEKGDMLSAVRKLVDENRKLRHAVANEFVRDDSGDSDADNHDLTELRANVRRKLGKPRRAPTRL